MRKHLGFGIVAAVFVLAACEGPAGPAGTNGQAGSSGAPCWEGLSDQNGDNVVDVLDCRGEDGQDGDPGTPGSAGTNGTSCSVTSNGDGTHTVACTDSTSAVISDGSDGSDGTSCTAVDSGAYITITCGSDTFIVNHGTDGAPGAASFSLGAEAVKSLTMTITSISISSPPVVNFTVKDAVGRGATGITAGASGNFRVNLSKLVPGAAAHQTPTWVNYIRGSSGPTYERTGSLVDNGDGTYVYTFATDVTNVSGVTWEPSLTHRLAGQVSGSVNGVALPAVNFVFDFVPAGSDVTTVRKMAAITSCNECHGALTVHGSRFDYDYCVSCHQPGLTNAATGNSLDMVEMVHAIHAAAKRDAEGLPAYKIVTSRNSYDYSHVGMPQSSANCRKCHSGDDAATPQGDNWKQYPSVATCGSCHNIASATTSHTAFTAAQCRTCHTPDVIEDTHTSENATPNNPRVPLNAAVFTYEISKVTVGAGGEPVVTFRVLKAVPNAATPVAAAPVVFNAYAGSTNIDKRNFVASGLLTGFTGSPSFLVAYAQPQDGIDEPADYNNLGKTAAQPAAVSIAELFTGDAGSIVASTSATDPAGSYVATISNTVSRSSTGCTPAPGAAPCGDITATSSALFPAGSSLRSVALQGYFTQVSPALARHTGSAMGAVAGEERRAVVSAAKCSACHEWFEGHGGNRVMTEVESLSVCTTCHVPNLTTSGRATDTGTSSGTCRLGGVTVPCTLENRIAIGRTDFSDVDATDPLSWPESTNNFKDMIHGIHASHLRSTAYTFVRDRGTSGVFYYDWSHVTFPNSASNCLACHHADTYLEVPASALASTIMIPDDDPNTNIGSSTTERGDLLELRKTVPNPSDIVNTPVASSCVFCHDSVLSAAHMEQNGAMVYRTRAEVAAAAPVETCALCHGEGRMADVTAVHGQ